MHSQAVTKIWESRKYAEYYPMLGYKPIAQKIEDQLYMKDITPHGLIIGFA